MSNFKVCTFVRYRDATGAALARWRSPLSRSPTGCLGTFFSLINVLFADRTSGKTSVESAQRRGKAEERGLGKWELVKERWLHGRFIHDAKIECYLGSAKPLTAPMISTSSDTSSSFGRK